MKQNIQDKSFVDFGEWKVLGLIEYLQSFAFDKDATITSEWNDWYISYSREETDEEYEQRLLKEEETRIKEEKQKVKRYEQYLKLKEEFKDKE